MKTRWWHIVIVAIATVGTSEFALRAALSAGVVKTRHLGPIGNRVETMERFRHDAAQDFRQYPYQHDPEIGWISRPGRLEHHGLVESVNSAGMRGPTEFEEEKSNKLIRISVFGDSYTYGADVTDGEPWPAQLGGLLGPVEVLNFGTAGYGHDQIMLNLERNGAAWNPDVVLVGLIDVDRDRNMVNFYNAPKPQFVLKKDQSLRLTNVPVPTPEQVLATHDRALRVVDVFAMFAHQLRHLGNPQGGKPDAHDVTAALFERLDDDADALGVPVFYVHLPNPHRLETSTSLEMFEEMAALCTTTKHRCVDTSPAILGAHQRDEDLTGGMTHFNARGYELIATEVMTALTEAGLVGSRVGSEQHQQGGEHQQVGEERDDHGEGTEQAEEGDALDGSQPEDHEPE